jgi:hypothetical protein
MKRGGGRIFDAHVEAEEAEANASARAAPPPEAAPPVAKPSYSKPSVVEIVDAPPLAAQRVADVVVPAGAVRAAPPAVQSPAAGQGVGVGPATSSVPVAATQAGGAGALARFQASGQAILSEGAWRLRQVGSAGLVGIGLLVGAAVLYTANTLPQSQAIGALKAQLAKLGPIVQGSPAAPQPQVALSGLPSRDEAPDVLARIYQEAQAAGVDLPRGTYEYLPARDGVAAHYRMTFPVRAGYPQLRTFMDHTLVALPSVAVEGLKIERKNVTDETVDAELKLSAFVRDGG